MGTPLQNRAAAYARWAKCSDRKAATQPAWRGFLARFENEVDPAGLLSEAERLRRADYARKAYYLRLAASGVAARKSRARRDAA